MSERGIHVACTSTGDGHCPLCGDAVVALRVDVVHGDGTACGHGPDGEATIALDLVTDVEVGDRVLVHQGFAIARLGAGQEATA